MTLLLVGLYAGLFVFAINGLQLAALTQKARELKAQEERLCRLLLRYRKRS